MNQNSTESLEKHGENSFFVRLFGWSVLTILAAFMINNALNLGFGATGVFELATGGGRIASIVYVAALAVGAVYVLQTRQVSLRWDAHILHKFNVFLIRGFFWAVLLIGIVDATIAFLRVEDFLPVFFDESLVKNLNRARFVGPYIHIPLIALSFVIAYFTRTVGFTWLALAIVVAELLIVITRFVFSYEQALMGDLVRYWYAALFLFASAYTLFDDGHVRVDVFYAGFSSRKRGIINALGCILLGITTSWVIIYIGFNGKTSIINSPVMNFEISQVGSVGMFIKYQMAAFLGIFAITMLIQFVSYFFESVADFRDEAGHRQTQPIAQ